MVQRCCNCNSIAYNVQWNGEILVRAWQGVKLSARIMHGRRDFSATTGFDVAFIDARSGDFYGEQ